MNVGEKMEATFQTSIILDRVIDNCPDDIRTLSVIRSTCKWYNNLVFERWSLYKRDQAWVYHEKRCSWSNRFFHDVFLIDGKCVFHANYDCKCDMIRSPCKMDWLWRLLIKLPNPERTHQLLIESRLLLDKVFFRLLMKIRKISDWIILYLMFHTRTATEMISFFRYRDEDGRVIQLCHHHMKRVYECSRYYALVAIGSEVDRLDEAELFIYDGQEKGMTWEQYVNGRVYGLSFFQDFLDDSGQYNVSKRVIGSFWREIQHHCTAISLEFYSGDVIRYMKCCDNDIVQVDSIIHGKIVSQMASTPGLVRRPLPGVSRVLGLDGMTIAGRVRRKKKKNHKVKRTSYDSPD